MSATITVARPSASIFASRWDHEHINVMVDEPAVRTYVQRAPRVYAEVWWGKRLAAVRVALGLVGEHELGELLADAWDRNGRSAGAG